MIAPRKTRTTSSLSAWDAHKLLLAAAILAFTSTSLYTTKLGLALVFQEGDTFVTTWLPWVLASGIALMLAFFTIQIALQRPGERIGGFIAGYVLFATISIFFNFNTFYTALSAKEAETEQNRRLINLARTQCFAAEASLKKQNQLDELDTQVGSALTARNFEETRPDRPGRKARWIVADQRYQELLSQRTIAVARFQADVTPVHDLIRSLNESSFQSYAQANAANTALIAKLSSLAAFMKSHNLPVTINVDQLLAENADRRSVSANLWSIVQQSDGAVSGSSGGASAARFALAVFLSVLLDASLLIGLLLARRSDPVRLGADPSARLWEDTKRMFEP